MAKKIVPPVVEAVAPQKTGLSMVIEHLEKLVGEVAVLESESRYRDNDKRAYVEGVLLGVIVDVRRVLGR